METSTDPTRTGRLVRPRRGRVVAGVAAAVAARTGFDVGIVRILFVVSLIFGGAGLVLYAAGWALLPLEGEDRSPAERWFGNDAG